MLLGLALIIDAIQANRLPIFQFIIGLIMIGLIPADLVIDYILNPNGKKAETDEEQIERLREVMRQHDEQTKKKDDEQ